MDTFDNSFDPNAPPQNPAERMNGRRILGDALKTFMFSLGQGAAAQGSAPGRRGSMLGVGAALNAPFLLQQMEDQRRQQQQDQMLKIAAFRQNVLHGQQGAASDLIRQLTGSNAPIEGISGAAPTMGSPNPVTLNDSANAIANQAVPPEPVMSGPNQTPSYGSIAPVPYPLGNGQSRSVPITSAQDIARSAAAADEAKARANYLYRSDKFIPVPGVGVLNSGTGEISSQGTIPEKQDLQLKFGKYDGKPMAANFNPRTGILSSNGLTLDPTQFQENKTDTPVEQLAAILAKGNKATPEEKQMAAALRNALTVGPQANQPNQDRAAYFKSYQFHALELDRLAKPIDDTIARFSRLQDTIAQNSPAADALMAPELLTVMAGGQGSGVRMTESELARIIGGRSKWESLKASINQWRLDPSKANSITVDQRNQIKSLVEAVGQKLTQKQQVLNDARTSLYRSLDETGHPQIFADAKQQLSNIDSGKTPGFSVQYNGKTYTFPSQGGLEGFKKEMKIP